MNFIIAGECPERSDERRECESERSDGRGECEEMLPAEELLCLVF